ncbi:MAG: acyl-CoA dehydratase activase [Thermodesulfobacteriota bacterium]
MTYVSQDQAASAIVGIDIGSVTVAMVTLAPDKTVVDRAYAFHGGKISETFTDMLSQFDLSAVTAVAATESTPSVVCADARFDNPIAIIAAVRHCHGRVGSVLNVGGEQFGLLLFDRENNYRGYRTNTSCAAGTGSFLDQQAGRLNLSGIAALAETAASNRGEIPKIASRCAVFAKTDLIHAQQEGYSIAEICDGLCQGLAKNIVNTLFKHETINTPLIFSGGVARNPAVVQHIGDQIGIDIVVDDMAPFYGAMGAAISMMEEAGLPQKPRSIDHRPLVQSFSEQRAYGHEPLQLRHSDYPDFAAESSYEFTPADAVGKNANEAFEAPAVEVDVYQSLSVADTVSVYLGIDIGSTSTKAVWMTPDQNVLAGFYTRTAGRPVQALCGLFAAMDDLVAERGIDFSVIGAGSTGSGRKFVGKLMGADAIIDEITAHARAAYALHPDVDTIIEIGGQDSKFTTLRQGGVTFSIMNTVCAAGTGSFIEEQAEKLGCRLSDYSERAEQVCAPVASDRCTVFMERDINDYLGRGYGVDEVLASALHAVRENYLTKVAVESAIGDVVCFQGATAKNRALVAAFEQRLNRPIHVSPFCHLTGALGVALHLADEAIGRSAFRGLGLYKTRIPVRSEVCEFCTNHCKITVADMPDGPVAYGFLCGRDYDTRHFVNNNRSGFDLYKARKKALSVPPAQNAGSEVTIGIPAGLYMVEDLSFWVDFFHQLNVSIQTSESLADPVKAGKSGVGAEFCAPITAMHGHVQYLLDRCDYVFLPHYLENKDKDPGARRQYCYYSQYMPALVATMDASRRNRIISPVMRYLYNVFHVRLELYRALKACLPHHPNFFEIAMAYERAQARKTAGIRQLRKVYEQEKTGAKDLSVMLLGRPYSVLPRNMNKNIPEIFAALGIKVFFQDMLDLDTADVADIEPFLHELHWNYAADILKAARVVSETDGVYPVLATSFKCAPDSFIRDVFKEIMEAAGKPYLILELDEHGSSVGYETRIEAAVRAFRNHRHRERADALADYSRINPRKTRELSGKTVVLPNWDPITCPFLIANLQREGIDARLMTETPDTIKRSMRLNSGQCIPINAMVQEFVEYVTHQGLDPAKTVLWMGHSEVACNIRLYPYQLKKMIESFGPEMAKAGVYTGTVAFTDISIRAAVNAYFAYMFGGQIRKMGCKLRPYEVNPGEVNRAIEDGIAILAEAFSGRRRKDDAVAEVVSLFEQIPVMPFNRPKAAIFGDLYARDNPVFNQDLIAFIEAHGGEVITTPYTDYAKMIASAYYKKWFTEGKYFSVVLSKTLLTTMMHQEKAYYRMFEKVLGEPEPVYDTPPKQILSEFGMVEQNTGESLDNLLKIYYIKQHHPEVALFVQTSPAFCCPSLVTEAMARDIEDRIGVPIVSITYDGTGGEKNRKIIPYLKLAKPPSDQDAMEAL